MFKRTLTLFIFGLFCVLVFAQDEDRHEWRWETNILTETFGYAKDTATSVDYDDLIQGCPSRDCIPAIDEPKFIAADKVDFLLDEDLVMGIEHAGVTRAYPIRILVFHEIVNDKIDDLPFVITYCPLCGSGLAYERVVDGQETTFGVSGILHDSDLVMYDRASDTLWQQITAEAIMGPKLGQHLTAVPMSMTRWSQWLAAHPNTQVLSMDTGHEMNYRQDQYAGYHESDKLAFPVNHLDPRIPPKTDIYGAETDAGPAAVLAEALHESGQQAVELAGHKGEFLRAPNGEVTLHFSDSGKTYQAHRMYWFAWANFHPDTLLFGQQR